MAKRTVFVSDLHIGSGSETNWYQKTVHEPLLKNFLRYLQDSEKSIDELVILGDWFDLWNYHPFCSPPSIEVILKQNPGVFERQSDGDFITLLDKVKVRYINGDHDMEVELRDLNRELGSKTFQKILPGHGSDSEKSAIANTYYMSEGVWAEHGNQHDLFNKPVISGSNPMAPLPLGYFVMRIYSHFLQKKMASTHRMDASCVAGCGSPDFETMGIKLSDLVAQLLIQMKRGEQLNPAKIVLDLMLQYNRNNSLEFRIEGKGLDEVKTEGVARFYPDLITEENFYEALCEAEVAYDGLGHFARMHFVNNPHAKIVVMGHTHWASMKLFGNSKTHVFANSGYFCPSVPDMTEGRALPGFVEVEKLNDGGLKIYQKTVNGTLPEDIIEVASFRV